MPTYEYRCTRCKHEFEQFQSMKDKPLKTCPACKKASLERLIGVGAAVIFKGSGFYQTDYRSEAYRKAAQADSSSGPSKESTDKPAGGDAGDSKKADAASNTPGDAKSGSDKASGMASDKPNDKNSGSDKSASSSSEKPSESSKGDSSRRSVAVNSGSSATTKSSSKPSAKPTAKKSASKAKATKR